MKHDCRRTESGGSLVHGDRQYLSASASTVVLMALALGIIAVPGLANAATINVASESQLRDAISNANSGDTIALTANVTLTADLPHIARNVNLTINGGDFTLSGNNTYRGLVIEQGTVAINNLTIANARAKGGDGGIGWGSKDPYFGVAVGNGGGGGGGAGLGGALFVGTAASVTVSNVNLTDNKAVGGSGGGTDRYDSRFQHRTSGGGGGMFTNASSGGLNQDGGGGAGGGGCGGGCNGEFGGGGGGAATTMAGSGGFGGGGGGRGKHYNNSTGTPGKGGFGGGDGDLTGGGGAGMGGAIFVQQGGKLNMAGDLNISGGSVVGGTGHAAGQAYGTGLFLQGTGSFSVAPGAGQTQTISDVIADQTGVAGSGGNWSLVKNGAGTTILTAANLYTGGTTVNAGVLQGTTTSLLGKIVNNATVVFDQAAGGSFVGTMSGTGDLRKIGAGELTLTGTHTYSGGTKIDAGVLRAEMGTSLGTGIVTLNGGSVGTTNATVAKTVFKQNVVLAGNGGIDVAKDPVIWSGGISGPGQFIKSGAGDLTLTGANTYAGGTRIVGGVLRANDETFFGPGAITVTTNGAVGSTDDTPATTTFTRSLVLEGQGGIDVAHHPITWTGVISGQAALVKTGEGELWVTGNTTYSGGTLIRFGTLRVDSDTKLGAAGTGVELYNNGALRASDTFTSNRAINLTGAGGVFNVDPDKALTLSGVVRGSSITKVGPGTLILTGANTYTGNINNNGGGVRGNTTSLRGNVVFDTNADNKTERLLAFDQGTTGTFSGQISGLGNVIKLGIGKLILTGVNSYNLGTTVSAGILQGNTNSVQGDILNTASVIFDQNVDGKYSGTMSGTGTLDKNGTGKLAIAKDQFYTGVTNINAGEFNTNATFQSSVVNVNVGGTLSGNGKFFAVNNNGGTISPGNSIGTITISGNLNMGPNSKYYAEINGAASDRIDVGGTASIQSSTFEVAHDTDKSAPPVLPGKTYTLITTQGGLTVTSPQVAIANFPFLSFTLSEDGFNGYLTTARSGDAFASLASTLNEKAVASALDAAGAGSPAWQQVVGATAAQARAAFTSLSNASIHANATGVMSEQSRYLRDAVTDRLRQDFSYGTNLDSGPSVLSYAPETARNAYVAAGPIPYVRAPPVAADQGPLYAAWAQGVGSRGSLGGDGNASRTDHSLGGVISGIDVTFDGRWRMGVAGGYSQSSFSSPGLAASGSSESYHVTLYGGGQFGAWGLRGGASFSWNDIVTTRQVAVVNLNGVQRGAYTSNTTQVFGELGHRFRFGTAMLEPFANVAYVRVDGNVNETGLLAVAGSSVLDTTYTTLGLRGGTNLTQTLTARGMLGWRHTLGDISPVAALAFQSGGTAFALNGSPIARDALVAEAGLDLALTANASVGVTWNGQFANGAQNNAVKGNLTWRF